MTSDLDLLGDISEVKLEPLDSSHVQALHVLADDPRVSITSSVPPDLDIDTVHSWVDKSAAGTEQQVFVIFADGELAGCCTLKELDFDSGTAEMSYWVGSRFWGLGITSRAAAMLRDYAFDTLGLKRLESHYLKKNNQASGRILEKLGFVADTSRDDVAVDPDGRFKIFAPDVWTFMYLEN